MIDNTNLREEAWSFALDQRAFGPRKLWVAFADADGTFRGLAHTDRTDRPELCVGPCIEHLVDWIACDDQHFRSSSLALGAEPEEWWDV